MSVLMPTFKDDRAPPSSESAAPDAALPAAMLRVFVDVGDVLNDVMNDGVKCMLLGLAYAPSLTVDE